MKKVIVDLSDCDFLKQFLSSNKMLIQRSNQYSEKNISAKKSKHQAKEDGIGDDISTFRLISLSNNYQT